MPSAREATWSSGSRGCRRVVTVVLRDHLLPPVVTERSGISIWPARVDTALRVSTSATPGRRSLLVNRVRNPSAAPPSGPGPGTDPVSRLVPHQATFARFEMARSALWSLWRLRQAM